MTPLEKIIENFPDERFLKADGLNDAIIGVDTKSRRLIYSTSKCIDILMKDMTYEEAIEYFDYNVEGAYVGEDTPIWCYDQFF